MKNIANRIAVIAVAGIALGTAAFGQTRMTAEIPFAFHTANGTLPAGTYQIEELNSTQFAHRIVYLRNAATGKGVLAGNPMFDARNTAASRLDFVCGADGCALKAIRTSTGSREYATPNKSKHAVEAAVISVELRAHNAD